MTPSFRPFLSARGFASHLYLLCLMMLASLLSACGGGAGTVGIATGTALFSNAPPSVVLAASATTNFIIGGGTPTYTASSSNRDVATASMSGTTLTVTAAGAGTATISVTDAAGASISVPVTVNAAPVVPVIPPGSLFTTSSGSVTLAVGAASNFGIGGGTAPYAVSSSNTGVTTASVSGSNFTVTGVASGAAEVVVTDARGAALTLIVTVGSNSAPVELFTTAPNAVTLAVGAGGSYNIGGGKPAYSVTSSNAGVVRVTLGGTSFNITGVAAGTSQVVVVDADGKRIDIAVVVGSTAVALPLFTTAPDDVRIAVGGSASYTAGGGTPNYLVSSSNTAVARVAINGADFLITGIAAGTAQIAIFDAKGDAQKLLVTIGAGSSTTALYTSASSSLVLAPGTTDTFVIGGGAGTYRASSSNSSVATVVLSGGTAANLGSGLSITGGSAGTAQVVVTDAAGASLSIAVTVSAGTVTMPPLFTTAPGSVTVGVGASGSYTVGGGSAPYLAGTSNASVATAAISGGVLTINGHASGTAQVNVLDSTGASVAIAVTVGTGGGVLALYTTAPDDVRIAVGASSTYSAGGGTPAYQVSSSNTAVARVTLSGADFQITGVAAGTAQIALFDAKGDAEKIIVTIGAGSTSTALYTSAASSLVLAPGVTESFAVGGGAGTYRVSSSNSGVATVSLNGSTLSVTAGAAGVAQVVVTDAVGNNVDIAVTVGAGSSQTALFTTAPGSVTVAVGVSATYTVGGGVAPYSAGSSNIAVASASVSGGVLTITGNASGTAQVNIVDATGATVSIAVTSGSGGTNTALFTSSSSTLVLATGASGSYAVGGGTGPYRVSSSNANVAGATLTGATGTSLTITGNAAGVAEVVVTDAVGATVGVAVTVGAGNAQAPLFTTAPDIITIAPGASGAYAIGGGRAPYAASTSNAAVATVTVSGSGLTITGQATGTAQINVLDAGGASVSVAVTVGTGGSVVALFTSAPGTLALAAAETETFAVGGGATPYRASSSNSAVVRVALAGSSLSVTGVAAGVAQVTVVDNAGASLSIVVTIGSGNSQTALFTTAPDAITKAVGTSSTYAVGGGIAPYRVSSSNAGVTAASLSGSTLTIAGNSAGVAQVVVTDAVGTRIGIAVTVGAGNTPAALFTTAPSAVTIGVGIAEDYAIGGGTAPYAASTSNSTVATVAVSGTGFTITGRVAGSAQVTVQDASGAGVSVAVTVGAANNTTNLFTSAPGTLALAPGVTEAFAVGGGAQPYRASSSNAAVARVVLTGSSLSITGVAAGVAQVIVTDNAGGSVSMVVTVGSGNSQTALFTTAPGAVSQPVGATSNYAVGGGVAPYQATTSNASVATVAISGNSLSITGISSGVVQVMVTDATGTSVGIAVTVGSGTTQSSLFTTAPNAVTVPVGASTSYTVAGGTAPYSVGSSNSAVASAAVSGGGLTITGNAAGTAQVNVLDATGATVSINVTVGVGGSSALYTTAPAAVTIGTGASGVYTVGGGAGGYVATTSNAAVVTVGVSGSTLTITPMTAGTASVQVFDSAGTSVTIAVTVTEVQPGTLLTQPSAATGNVGDSLVFLVSGGSPSYTITVSNTSIASVSPSTVGASGGSFMLTLHNVGTTVATITDARGRVTTVPITVEQISTVLRVSPSALQVAETNSESIALNVYGGTGPYRVFTNNENLTSVSVSGSVMTIGLGSNGNRCINPITEAGTYIPNGLFDVTLTAVDSLGASATAVLTIKDNGAGFGVGCP